MRWLKRNLWKAGVAFVSISLLLVLVGWVPMSVAAAYEKASRSALPRMVTVQPTPTVDATVTALQKEQLAQQVAQQNHTWGNWLWSNAATIVSSVLSTLVIVIGILIGLWRWRVDRGGEFEKRREDQRIEQEKRAEERFRAVVDGLGSERIEAKVGAAIMLRTFLQPGYEKFYQQTFDLAVTHLRLRSIDPNTPKSLDPNENEYVPLDSLSQALITVFKESFQRARDRLNQEESRFEIEIKFLDASHIRLDDAYLRDADLKNVQMREASLMRAELRKANLSHAYLTETNLSHANLRKAILSGARLHNADLSQAHLREAHLEKAYLRGANFDGAGLNRADLTGADFDGKPRLDTADLTGADLREAKGAIIDEDSTTGASPSTVTASSSLQSTDGQASSIPGTDS